MGRGGVGRSRGCLAGLGRGWRLTGMSGVGITCLQGRDGCPSRGGRVGWLKNGPVRVGRVEEFLARAGASGWAFLALGLHSEHKQIFSGLG